MIMLIAPPEALVKLTEPWNKFYSDSKLTETIVMFLHTAGVLIGGGIAISADRFTLRARNWGDAERRHHVTELSKLHRVVVTSLGLTAITGVAMFCSDVETFWGSWIFWAKMAVVTGLLLNGARMLGVEKGLAADSSGASPYWAKLRTNAMTSMTLWLTATLAGLALVNYA
ncbi:MAG TPA: hypothetical protein VIV65_06765 [Gemmatimonadaceae bacterium]|jgi:hypothetical protein